jgi:hypothetical protein
MKAERLESLAFWAYSPYYEVVLDRCMEEEEGD